MKINKKKFDRLWEQRGFIKSQRDNCYFKGFNNDDTPLYIKVEDDEMTLGLEFDEIVGDEIKKFFSIEEDETYDGVQFKYLEYDEVSLNELLSFDKSYDILQEIIDIVLEFKAVDLQMTLDNFVETLKED